MSKNCTPLWQKSTFVSENAQKLRVWEHFKAHLEVKMLEKIEGLGTLFEVLMSKNCTLLWRKAHL